MNFLETIVVPTVVEKQQLIEKIMKDTELQYRNQKQNLASWENLEMIHRLKLLVDGFIVFLTVTSTLWAVLLQVDEIYHHILSCICQFNPDILLKFIGENEEMVRWYESWES